MILVTADSDRSRLEALTLLLVSAFPGSTIYQHAHPLRVTRDAIGNNVAGVFLEAEMEEIDGIELMQMLRRQKSDIPVYILSENEGHRGAAMEMGANGFFLRPIKAEILKNTLLSK